VDEHVEKHVFEHENEKVLACAGRPAIARHHEGEPASTSWWSESRWEMPRVQRKEPMVAVNEE
jgi:hypothetical protein